MTTYRQDKNGNWNVAEPEPRSGASGWSMLWFTGGLTLLFAGWKIGHFINWSWWWVLAPLWIPWGLIFLIALVFLVRELVKR
jgi:hypothetical protein